MTQHPFGRKEIVLYSLSTCSHCKDVKRLLQREGVNYSNIEVDLLEDQARKDTIQKVRHYNPKVTFPTTVINDKVVVGNKRDRILEFLKGQGSPPD